VYLARCSALDLRKGGTLTVLEEFPLAILGKRLLSHRLPGTAVVAELVDALA